MSIEINDRVYVIENASDEHYGVVVIPAKIRRIVRTEEADALGVVTESVSYMVAYDGEGAARSFHHVSESGIVHIPRFTYNEPATVGLAIIEAIKMQVPTPIADAPPPAASLPATVDSATEVPF